MTGKCLCWLALAAATVAATARGEESVSVLMEKAIYTEETVGDLDAAIQLYQRVVAEAAAVRSVAARAQFRLGQCLLKQGKKDQATAAFEELVRRFPGEKDLVAKAQKLIPAPAGLKLQPVPWADGEALQYGMRLAAGLPLGTMIYTVQSDDLDGRKIWRTRKINAVVVNRQLGLSWVEADFGTFQPIRSSFRLPALGDTLAVYHPHEVAITTTRNGEKTTRTTAIDKVVYDNEQGVELFRRLPLEQVTQRSVPIFVPFGAGEIEIGLEVLGKETVEVPAGTFECLKVNLSPVNQTFWFSTDEHRYVVKMDANNVLVELATIATIVPGGTKTYEAPENRFRLALPSDWFPYRPGTNDVWFKTPMVLVEPSAEAMITVEAVALADLSDDAKKSPRAWLEQELEQSKPKLKDLQVRADRWQEMEVGGHPAASVVADYVVGGQLMAQYEFAVLGRTTALRLTAQVPRDKLDAFVPAGPDATSQLLSVVKSVELE